MFRRKKAAADVPPVPRGPVALHSVHQELPSERVSKKLDKFLDKTNPTAKRLKHLAILVNGGAPDSQVRNVLSDHAVDVFDLAVKDAFERFAVPLPLKNAKAVSITPLIDTLAVLQRATQLVPDLARKWSMPRFVQFIGTMLIVDNRADVRLAATRVLVGMINSLGPTCAGDETLMELLEEAPVLEAFPGAPTAPGALPNRNATASGNLPTSSDAVVPLRGAQGSSTPEDTVALVRVIFEHALKERVVFWLALLKKRLFKYIYPEMARDIGALAKADHDVGFVRCPDKLQAMLGAVLLGGMKDPESFSALFSSVENTRFCLAVTEASLGLPPEYQEHVHAVVDLYRQWAKGQNRPPIVQNDSQKYHRICMRHLLQPFRVPAPPADQGALLFHQINIAKDTFDVFKTVAMLWPGDANLDSMTQLLDTILEATDLVFENKALALEVGDGALQTVYNCWIRSGVAAPDRWDKFEAHHDKWLSWMSTVRQWKRTMVQLTTSEVILDHLFGESIAASPGSPLAAGSHPAAAQLPSTISLSPRGVTGAPASGVSAPPSPARGGGGGGGGGGDGGGDDSGAAGESAEVKVDLSLNLRGLKWTAERASFVWKRILFLFVHLDRIQDPKVHTEAVSGVALVLELLLKRTEAMSISKESKITLIPMLRLFGPPIFAACSMPDKFAEGKAVACGAACRLLCRAEHHESDPDLRAAYIPHLLRVVFEGLQSGDANTVSSIVLNSQRLFNLDLPGANVVLPEYVSAIKTLIAGAATSLPRDIQKAILVALCGIISLPHHFHGLLLPNVGGLVARDAGAADADGAVEESRKLSFANLLESVGDGMLELLRHSKDATVVCSCAWAISVVLIECIYSDKEAFFVRGFGDLVTLADSDDEVVAHSSMSALQMLACIAPRIRKQSVAVELVETLAGTAVRLLRDAKGTKGSVIAQTIYAVLEWVAARPLMLQRSSDARTRLFGLVARALDWDGASTGAAAAAAAAGGGRKDPRPKGQAEGLRSMIGSRRTERSHTIAPLAGWVGNQSGEDSIVREAAAALLQHLLNHHMCFPLTETPAVNDSTGAAPGRDEEQERCRYFFGVHGGAVTSILRGKDVTSIEVVTRDLVGKHLWRLHEKLEIDGDDLDDLAQGERETRLRSSSSLIMQQRPSDPAGIKHTGPAMYRPEADWRMPASYHQPSQGRVAVANVAEWAESLDATLTSEIGALYFGRFLMREFCFENLSMYLDICDYERMQDSDFAKYLFETYLPHNAPRMVNVSADAQTHVIEALARDAAGTALPADLYEQVKRTLFDLMGDPHRRFVRGSEAMRAAQFDERMGTEVVLPRYYPVFEASEDPFGAFLEFAGRTHDDCPAIAAIPTDCSTDTMNAIQKAIEQQEASNAKRKPRARDSSSDDNGAAPTVPGGDHGPRLAASRLGFVSLRPDCEAALLVKGERLLGGLTDADGLGSRDTAEVAVAFVPPQALSLDEVAAVRHESAGFSQFVRDLGRPVDVGVHVGFTGSFRGKGGPTGCVYHATSTVELFMHVTTRTGSADDVRRMLQTRAVQVVWCEEPQGVFAESGSEVQIVVMPLETGLCLCRVKTSGDVPLFGPLLDGMTVGRQVLPDLVRETAINATKVVGEQRRLYQRPMAVRHGVLADTIVRSRLEGEGAVYAAGFLGS